MSALRRARTASTSRWSAAGRCGPRSTRERCRPRLRAHRPVHRLVGVHRLHDGVHRLLGALNLAIADGALDPFPFIFLTLLLSLQASYAAPLILLAQNRQADRDRVQYQEDRAAHRAAARRHRVPHPRDRRRCAWPSARSPPATSSAASCATCSTTSIKALDEHAEGAAAKAPARRRRAARPSAALEPHGGRPWTPSPPTSIAGMPAPSLDAVDAALATVNDPEIHRPITELGMVKSARRRCDGVASRRHLPHRVRLPDARHHHRARAPRRSSAVPGVTSVDVELDVMSDEQRNELCARCCAGTTSARSRSPSPARSPASTRSPPARAASASPRSPPTSPSRWPQIGPHASASSTPTSTATRSRACSARPSAPTMVEGMIMPPQAYGVRVISMLPFKPGGVSQPVAFRGPMLHRALQQFLADVWWGDLDVLLLDLPAGHRRRRRSRPRSCCPTPRSSSSPRRSPPPPRSPMRAGTLAQQTHQKVAGVVENMSSFPCPHCGEPMDLFGSGGGRDRRRDAHPPARHRRPAARPGAVRRGAARGRRLRRTRSCSARPTRPRRRRCCGSPRPSARGRVASPACRWASPPAGRVTPGRPGTVEVASGSKAGAGSGSGLGAGSAGGRAASRRLPGRRR